MFPAWRLHQKAVREAVRRAGKHVTAHTFRHSFATHLLEDGYEIRTVQELMGHESVKTTQKFKHVLNRGGLGVRSPLDSGLGRLRAPIDAYTDLEHRIAPGANAAEGAEHAGRSNGKGSRAALSEPPHNSGRPRLK